MVAVALAVITEVTEAVGVAEAAVAGITVGVGIGA